MRADPLIAWQTVGYRCASIDLVRSSRCPGDVTLALFVETTVHIVELDAGERLNRITTSPSNWCVIIAIPLAGMRLRT